MTRAVKLAEIAAEEVLTVDSTNSRIGIGSTQPTVKLDVDGVVVATAFTGDGSNLTGVVAEADLGTLSNINVTGIATFNSLVNVGSNIKIDATSGIATATTFSGNITGVAATFTGGVNVSGASNIDVTGVVTATTFSGNITGVAATFSGDVTIGGELTYEDVTNVDSVGFATFRKGINVQGAGSTTTTLNVTGVSTFGGNVSIADSIFHTGDTNTAIRFPAADTFTVETGGSEALRITSAGQLQATGAADVRLTLGSGGTAGTNDSVYMRADGASLKFMSANGGNTIFETNGTETFRITSAGLLLGGTDSQSNTTLGANAGDSMTGTAYYNTLIGQDAGTAMTTADTNTVVGAYALSSATTASMSCAFGYHALKTSDAWYNNAFGKDALENCSSGTNNNAFGYLAMDSHTTGSNNSAFGDQALSSNTTSWSNSAFGAQALTSNTGASNTAVGRGAMYTNTSGYQNASVGRDSLYDNDSGINNAALGYRSLRKNTSGNDNVAVGRDSGYFNTTGSGNISIGVCNSSGSFAPVFTLGTSNDRVVMGSTAVTNAYVQVAWTVVSDARDKMNFGTVPHGLEFIKQLNPVSFQFKFTRDSSTPNGPVRYGFKAQDIIALEGEDNAVIIDNEDPNKLRYNGEALVPVLVNAIKEQQVIIDALLARIDAAGI